MNPPEAALACATALVDALVANGVAGFVVSPGSRSTPLTLAIARSDIPSWIVLDERSAGFFALGRASAMGAPVGIVCTSGTAVANLLPALVEASQRRVPLIAITADRPPELHGVGANQTIPQAGIFGRFVRHERTLPVADPEQVEAWRATGGDAALRAQLRPRGPVHVNAAFREPFLPMAPGEDRTVQAGGSAREPDVLPSEEDVAFTQGHLDAAARCVVYVGGCDEPLDADAVQTACHRLGVILVTDVTSGIPGFGSALCGTEAARVHLRPDLVLQLGRAPTTRATQGFLDTAETLITVDPDGWRHDPALRAARTITASPLRLLEALAPRSPDLQGAERWERASDAIAGAMAPFGDELWEGAVARIVWGGDADIVIGNSTPVRDLDGFRDRRTRRIVANRGASGIDGLVSMMAGVASSGRPTVALLGDLSVLHDASGLVWLAREHAGTLVVVDNDGGGIFDLLAGAALPEHERWFVTPHHGRLPSLLRAVGVEVRTVTSCGELAEALATVSTEPPMRILHVPIERARAVEIRALVRAACDREALAALKDPRG